MNRRRIEISLGILVLVSLAILAYLAVQMGHLKGIGQTVRVQVVFPNASGLVEDASVKVAGVKIGRVERLEVDFDQARATLLLDRDAHIRKDARVTIRARSLLGEKYVEISPRSRTAPLARDGDVLEAGPIGLDMDELVGELGPLIQGVDIKKLGVLVDQINALVADNSEGLTQAIQRLNDILARVQQVQFDDPATRDDVRTLIHNLAQASRELPHAVRKADETLTVFAEQVEPALQNLDTAAAEIGPAITRLQNLVDQAQQTMTAIDQLITLLSPMLERLGTVDYARLRKVLREEGVLIRLIPHGTHDRTSRDSGSRDETPSPPPPAP